MFLYLHSLHPQQNASADVEGPETSQLSREAEHGDVGEVAQAVEAEAPQARASPREL